MKPFFDLHCHMLCGVDDGAKNQEMMFGMLDAAYADGVRAICLTPHFSPYLFGDTYEKSQEAFAVLSQYAAQKYPDVHLCLGHELGYYNGCAAALADGVCRTVAGSRYVLVDFPEKVDFYELSHAMDQLRSMGYCPILAHTERYRCLFSKIAWIRSFVNDGGVVQINASSAIGDWGRGAKGFWKKLVKERLAHIVSSDGHNLTSRPPLMSICMEALEKYGDPQYVRDLTWNNACRVVQDQAL
ncbi:MAG: hypothetical protein IJW30_05495 [Clostridia bacterium]|nr:hypothetical protein [Clostridia bacterium]